NFMEWLRSDNSIYWINGKAGSGKSTLMKFVYDDPRLMKALKSSPWAGGLPVIKASFYFWYNGTEMQKSLRGLLLSLLHQILKDQPHLISSIFAGDFELPDNQFDFENFPTQVDLTRALRQSLEQPSRLSNYIFFIDGLDEYRASEREMVTLVELFNSLAALSCVKFVLSSRPLPIFVQAFKKGPTLELSELTKYDIERFVKDKLYVPLVQQYDKEDSYDIERLITYIVGEAKGVFRWVDLVVEAVLKGIRD
ncbi:hypothetical protein DL95DRAFT_239390, partial [Leptodontidium sp. 2 PMI_412]